MGGDESSEETNRCPTAHNYKKVEVFTVPEEDHGVVAAVVTSLLWCV